MIAAKKLKIRKNKRVLKMKELNLFPNIYLTVNTKMKVIRASSEWKQIKKTKIPIRFLLLLIIKQLVKLVIQKLKNKVIKIIKIELYNKK